MLTSKHLRIGFAIAGAVALVLLYAGFIRHTTEAERDAHINNVNPMQFKYLSSDGREVEDELDELDGAMKPNDLESSKSLAPTLQNITGTSTKEEIENGWDDLLGKEEPTTEAAKPSTTTPKPIIIPKLIELIHYKGSTFFLEGQDICTNSTHMVILIQSAPKHHSLRMVMRQTWASLHHTQKFLGEELKQEVKIGYMFGESYDPIDTAQIMEENRQFNDVIISEFHDSYRNLTLKTLASMEWVNKYCPSAKYFVKCDDDTMVNVVNLLRFLKVNQLNNGMTGALVIGHDVKRYGKWGVDPALYPDDRYPPYYSGPCYVMHTEIIPKMLLVARSTPMLPIEDAYVTGIVARAAGVRRFSPGGFANTFSRPPQACEVQSWQFYTGSGLTEDYLYYLFDTLTSGSVKC